MVLGPLMGVFAEPVEFRPAGGGTPISVSGVFDRAYTRDVALEDGSIGVTTESPTLGVRLSDFQSPPKQNDRFFIPSAGATFIVREVRVDGHGAARCLLNKVAT